jgi:hypothetical protein
MLSKFIGELLACFSEVVLDVKIIEYSTNDFNDFHFKGIIELRDGSTLRINQTIEYSGIILKYSYYWLDENNHLIIGWDNVPHHREIKSYPHHKHVARQQNVEHSTERSLNDVLSFIALEIEINQDN